MIKHPAHCVIKFGHCLWNEVSEPAHAERLLVCATAARACAVPSPAREIAAPVTFFLGGQNRCQQLGARRLLPPLQQVNASRDQVSTVPVAAGRNLVPANRSNSRGRNTSSMAAVTGEGGTAGKACLRVPAATGTADGHLAGPDVLRSLAAPASIDATIGSRSLPGGMSSSCGKHIELRYTAHSPRRPPPPLSMRTNH